MESSDKAELKAHMLARREELARQVPALKEASRPVAPDDALGRLTRMDAMQSREMSANAMRKVQAQLAGLDHALRRMDDPDFGLCAGCDQAIPLARLKAMPGATRCVNCA